MADMDNNNGKPMDHLLSLMEQLRGSDGCPWDRKQTHESLRPYVVEEAYEVVEAIDNGNREEIQEELGDLLLQIVFHSQIAQENGQFTFDDVVNGISEKLERRHPHVFGDEEAMNEEEALVHWERMKVEKEGKDKSKRHRGTPILHRALRLQDKAVGFGFDWEETSQLLEKLEEEIREIREALESGNKEEITEEVGDLLFMAVNLARFLEIHPADALELSMTKFSNRFQSMKDRAKAQDRSLESMNLDEMESLWEEAKAEEKS
jgi:tetrapyrrole methylase family protein/MazG family protein